jgi:Tissue inhibitor of metalloproteinase
MKTLIAVFVALILSLWPKVPSANACSCGRPPTVSRSLRDRNIDYVFRGYVNSTIEMTIDGCPPEDPDNPCRNLFFDVQVLQVYKGCSLTNGTSIVVSSIGCDAACGIGGALRLGDDYVFSGYIISTEPLIVGVGLCNFNTNYDFLVAREKRRLKYYWNLCF